MPPPTHTPLQFPLFAWQLAVLVIFAWSYGSVGDMTQPLASINMMMQVGGLCCP